MRISKKPQGSDPRDMKMKISLWDPVDRLKTNEALAAYREAAQELGDPDLLAAAEADIARAIKKAEVSSDENITATSG